MSKLTVIARFYTIILTGYHQTKRKTEKTESRSQTCLDYAEVHPVFAGTAKTSRFALKTALRKNCDSYTAQSSYSIPSIRLKCLIL